MSRALRLSTFALAAACATPAASSGPTPMGSVAPSSRAIPSTTEAPGRTGDDLVGKQAPDFTATAQDGTPAHLGAWKGKRVVLYFYPKDETPGCTKEACSFRDAWQSLSKTGAVLVGISADTTESHKDFAEHYKLPFLLVSDPDGKIGAAYGVPFGGHHQRQTIVVGADGKVLKVYRTVDVTLHAAQILDDLTVR